jgi:hypothetical protein
MATGAVLGHPCSALGRARLSVVHRRQVAVHYPARAQWLPPPGLPLHLWGIAIADLLLEIPIIKIAKLYTYYGDNQPFFNQHWFPLPLWFISTNRLFDLVPALVILLLMSFRTKWVISAIPFVMFGSMYASYAFVTWPTVSALHSGTSPRVAALAAAYTIVVGVAATFAGAQLAPRMTNIMIYHDGPSARSKQSVRQVAVPQLATTRAP